MIPCLYASTEAKFDHNGIFDCASLKKKRLGSAVAEKTE